MAGHSSMALAMELVGHLEFRPCDQLAEVDNLDNFVLDIVDRRLAVGDILDS